jgi:hypothetical protein
MYSMWASFQPRQAKPRTDPRQLFYPNEFSRVFEKHWDYLTCLDQRPDFGSESKDTQYHMSVFSRALSGMSQEAAFDPSRRPKRSKSMSRSPKMR